MMTKRPFPERFWNKVAMRGPKDCWPWTASLRRQHHPSGWWAKLPRVQNRAQQAGLGNPAIPEGEQAMSDEKYSYGLNDGFVAAERVRHYTPPMTPQESYRAIVVERDRFRQQAEEVQAEVKRLRIQLGCVKATAILWDEEADEREQASREADVSPGFAGSLYARALLGREHAAAIRDMLMETPEDDVVEAVILCGQSSGMFGVAECSRLDGHDSHHEDSSTGWTWRR